MIFPTTELAARIERAERDLLTAFAEVANARNAIPGSFIEPIAGGIASWSAPDSPINKIASLGFHGVPTGAQLDDIEQQFFALGSPVIAEVATLADPAVAEALTRRGYILMGHENIFAMRLAEHAQAEPDPSITIECCDAQQSDTWIDTVVDGFLAPDLQGVQAHELFDRQALHDVMQDTSRAGGFLCLLASRNSSPAGGASVRFTDNIAQLCGCAVLPDHRGNGVQSHLLRYRLALACENGCDLAVMTTQPGSKSHHNALRQGFQHLYSRAVLVKAPGV
jgi:GNAT superfamily N-acetyltransferase